MSRKSRRANPTTGTLLPVEQKGKSTTWTIPVIISVIGALLSIGYTTYRISAYYGNLDAQLVRFADDIKEIKRDLKDLSKETKETLQRIDNQLVRMEERVKNLELRDKAVAYGFQDPNIVPVRLSEPSPPITNKPNEEISYRLRFTIKELTEKKIQFSIDGEIGTVTIKDTIATLPLKIGIPVDLMRALSITPSGSSEFLRIWLVILEAPTNNTVVIAVGPKAAPPATNIG